MNALCLLILSSLAVSPDDSGIATYTYAGGHIIVRHFSGFTGDGLTAQPTSDTERHTLVEGTLATIELPEKGFTLKGKKIDLTWAQAEPKVLEIRSGLIEGNASLHLDSAAGFLENTKFATERNLPKPKAALVDRICDLTSNVFQYSGNKEKGTVTLPGTWTYQQADKGTLDKVEKEKHTLVQFDQTFTVDSASGTVHLIKGKTGSVDQIETGTIIGPVHFKLVRQETPADTGKTSTSTYVGTADRIDIDMTTHPGTITATGHVKVDGESEGNNISFADEKIVITVSPELEPITIKLGSGQTTIKPKDGKQ